MEKAKQTLRKYLYLDTWQRWEYKHTSLVIVGVGVFILLLDTSFMTTVLGHITALGYAGAFLTGILFVSLLSVVPAIILLLSFAHLNVAATALIAGLGAMAGDYLILQYVEYQVAYELKPLALRFGVPQAIAYLQGRKSTLGLVRLLGVVVIASPLPDEIGIGLLGMGKLKRRSFLAMCYVLNVTGIAVIIVVGRSL